MLIECVPARGTRVPSLVKESGSSEAFRPSPTDHRMFPGASASPVAAVKLSGEQSVSPLLYGVRIEKGNAHRATRNPKLRENGRSGWHRMSNSSRPDGLADRQMIKA